MTKSTDKANNYKTSTNGNETEYGFQGIYENLYINFHYFIVNIHNSIIHNFFKKIPM